MQGFWNSLLVSIRGEVAARPVDSFLSGMVIYSLYDVKMYFIKIKGGYSHSLDSFFPQLR